LGSVAIDKGELNYSDNNFQIEYLGLDFRAGESLRYQYKLEGADGDWRVPTEETSVTFANLRPGSYRFLVRAMNSEGAVSETPASVAFVIVPPVWQRWWFLLLAAVVTALVIISLFRYRTARLREVNVALSEAKRSEERLRRLREERLAELESVRARIATDLHDDIGASLTQIAILSEVAQAQSKGNGAASAPLAKISNVSNELVGTMSDIVWSINPAKDHLSDLAQRMRRFAADILSPRNVAIHFSIPGSGETILVNANVRREVFLVFKEAINNIAKHSGATSVDVKLDISRTEVLLEIKDNGVGFENKEPTFEDTFSSEGYSGNGLPSMNKRAKAMGGYFAVISEVGKGTTITLKLPREQAFDDSMIPNSGAR
jgi:signal transduction histidine kinase